LITNRFSLVDLNELFASGHPWFRELAAPEWRLLELPTGHWPKFSGPDDLAELLDDILHWRHPISSGLTPNFEERSTSTSIGE